jgi:hypothetical protein
VIPFFASHSDIVKSTFRRQNFATSPHFIMEPSFYAGLNDVRNNVSSLGNQAPIPETPSDEGQNTRQENNQTYQHGNFTNWTVDNPTVWRGGLSNAPANLRDPRMSVTWRRPTVRNGAVGGEKSMVQGIQSAQQNAPSDMEMEQDDDA